MNQRSLRSTAIRRPHRKAVAPRLSVVYLSVMAVLGAPAIANEWSYPEDPGFVARSASELPAAKGSWETPEYGTFTGTAAGSASITMPWQLVAINASTAYALGYYGQGATLGMMDSGYRATHQSFLTPMIAPVRASGVYGTSGFGYRGATPTNPFTAGAPFIVDGDQPRTSDWSHGTGMLGVTSGKRDGIDTQQGIAFGSMMYVAMTGGSDSQSHGPFHDYVFWYTANKALVDAGAKVINSSWGSYVQTLNRAQFDGLGNNVGSNPNAYQLRGKDSTGATAMATILPNEELKDLEYQYFFFKKSYCEGGIQFNPAYPCRSFMDAIWEAIKDSGTVNVRSAGNNDWSNPYYRPAYPLFNPWAENQWVAVGGVQPPTAANPEYTKQYGYNEAGLAKWWTVSTPSNSVRTTSSGGDTAFSNSSGTSPATPVATGVMGVLMSRFPDMDAMQVRDLMLTTSNNKMTDGVRFLGTGQTSPTGVSIAWTAPDGLPDERWGWGIPDLAKGLYGPAQFLRPMVYNQSTMPVDVWTNDISQVAIKEREREDKAWLAAYKQQGIAMAGDFSPNVLSASGEVHPQAFMVQGLLNDPAVQAITNGRPEMYDKIPYADALKWRKEWMDARAAHIQDKVSKGQYNATLTKTGPGALFLTGNNSYAGATTVAGGKLSIVGSSVSPITVSAGGTLGGTGAITGVVNVLNGGTLWPGVSASESADINKVLATVNVAPGDVLRTGVVKVGSGATFKATLKAGGVSSRINASSAVALGGKLQLDVAARANPGDVYTLIQATLVQGTFAGQPEGSLVAGAGQQFRISYQGGKVTLTAI